MEEEGGRQGCLIRERVARAFRLNLMMLKGVQSGFVKIGVGSRFRSLVCVNGEMLP